MIWLLLKGQTKWVITPTFCGLLRKGKLYLVKIWSNFGAFSEKLNFMNFAKTLSTWLWPRCATAALLVEKFPLFDHTDDCARIAMHPKGLMRYTSSTENSRIPKFLCQQTDRSNWNSNTDCHRSCKSLSQNHLFFIPLCHCHVNENRIERRTFVHRNVKVWNLLVFFCYMAALMNIPIQIKVILRLNA